MRDVITALRVREYDFGKAAEQYKGQGDTFYTRYYALLDDGTKSPERIVVEGRAELFAEMPNEIQWGLYRIIPEDLKNMQVINSGGWNKHPGDYGLIERYEVLMKKHIESRMRGTMQRVIDMAQDPTTFMEEKFPTLVARSEKSPWTILEGNHTMLAVAHIWRSTGKLARDTVLGGILPRGAHYRFLRDGEALNAQFFKTRKTMSDIPSYTFPSHVVVEIRS